MKGFFKTTLLHLLPAILAISVCSCEKENDLDSKQDYQIVWNGSEKLLPLYWHFETNVIHVYDESNHYKVPNGELIRIYVGDNKERLIFTSDFYEFGARSGFAWTHSICDAVENHSVRLKPDSGCLVNGRTSIVHFEIGDDFWTSAENGADGVNFVIPLSSF